jgi:hypothetical protein
MTDNFMSGWGGAAKKKSKYVVECDTLAQAEHIASVAREQRSEMAYVHVTTKEPKFYPLRKYQVTRKTWADLGGVWKEDFQD